MESLDELRKKVDALDSELVRALGQRLEVCRKVALLKRQQGLPMMQPQRVAFVKQRCAQLGVAHGLNEAFVQALYTLIIDEACRLEDEIMTPSPP
jgi:chorismate mutase-like protein